MNLVLLRGRSATAVEADVQSAIAACMSDEQFAYTPANRVAGDEDVTLPLREIQTRRESIGYGIVNRAFGQTVPDPNRAVLGIARRRPASGLFPNAFRSQRRLRAARFGHDLCIVAVLPTRVSIDHRRVGRCTQRETHG